jgi:hypothetical protein
VSVCLGLAGLLPAAAVGHVAAAPAAASECPAEEVCVWSGAGYSGTVTVIQDEACDTAPVGSAMENDGDTLQELRVYPQPGCAGTAVAVRAGQSAPNLSGKSYQNWHDPRAAP